MKQASQLALRSNIMPIKHEPRVYLYEIGETVTLDIHAGYFRSGSDTFSVLAQLPPLGDDLQYRIKSVDEPYQRVVAEHQLTRVLSMESPWARRNEEAR